MQGRGFGSARELSDRAGGAVFFFGFGTAWVLLSSIWLRWMHVWSGTLVGVCGVLLFVWAWRFSAEMEQMAGPAATAVSPEQAAAARAYKWANIGQYVAMFVASVSLILLRRPDWIMAAIGIIVGLHLLPLAYWYRNPAHYVTAALLIAWSAVLMVLLPPVQVPGWSALGTGVLLVASAGVTLVRAIVASRRLGLVHVQRVASDVGG